MNEDSDDDINIWLMVIILFGILNVIGATLVVLFFNYESYKRKKRLENKVIKELEQNEEGREYQQERSQYRQSQIQELNIAKSLDNT
jgi:hypothetical protein